MSKDSVKNRLRLEAEAKIRKQSELIRHFTHDDYKSLLHELEVHQVELEMQNEELREAQHRLEEARDKYTDLFDFAPVGYLVLNKNGVITDINLTACNLLGIERSLIRDKPLSAYIVNGESGVFLLHLRDAFSTGVLHPFEIKMKHKSRGNFTALLQGIVVKDDDLERSVCRVSLTDITEQKEAESLQQRHDDLEKEKENIQQYLDFAPVIFLLLDSRGNVQMINQKGSQLLGYQNHEILGKNWFNNFMGKINTDTFNTSVFNVEQAKPTVPPYFESTLLSKNHREHIMAWTSVPLDRKGTVLGTLMAGEDITDRKILEQQKQEYTDDLEKIVEERTKKLTEALHNEKIVNEMKSAFVSMASHEFRTPLTSIMSSAILIEKYNSLNEFDKEKRHIDRIKLSVKRLTDILEDFLSLDKLERGLISSEKEAFDICLFTKDIIEEYEWMLKDGQHIYYEHKGDPSIFFDQNILRNIISNLLSNAIKYSDADITLFTIVKNEQVHIHLLDKGIGIPEEDKKYLFTKFFRAKNVTSIQGTGLGLSIVKHYIDLLGGEIEFTSQLGQGSAFKIVLPQQYKRNQHALLKGPAD